jgi:hypothetical protein
VRRRGQSPADPVPVMVSAADPLNFRGILTPDDRIAPATRTQVQVAWRHPTRQSDMGAGDVRPETVDTVVQALLAHDFGTHFQMAAILGWAVRERMVTETKI